MNEILLAKTPSPKPETSNQTKTENNNGNFKDELDRACCGGSESQERKIKGKERSDESPSDASNESTENQELHDEGTAETQQSTSGEVKKSKGDNVAAAAVMKAITDPKVAAMESSVLVSEANEAQVIKLDSASESKIIKPVSQPPQNLTPSIEKKSQKVQQPKGLDTSKSASSTVDDAQITENAGKKIQVPDGKLTQQNIQPDVVKRDLSNSQKTTELNILQSVAKQTGAEVSETPSQSIKTETSIHERTHILNKKWASNIAAKIAVNSANGMQSIRARINPASMGPIEIQISKVDESLNISMIVSSNATRELLDNNQSKILQSMKDAGMDVGGFDINQQNQQQKDSDESRGSKGTNLDNYPEDDMVADDIGMSENIRLIDSYA
jgi:flagellar hook-length control protein FliK